MTIGRRVRLGRVVAAVLMLCCLSTLLIPPPTGAHAAPGEGPRAALTLTGLSPAAPGPGDTLDVEGVITNTGSSPARDVRVQLAVSDRPVTSRSQLAALAGDETDTVWPPTGPVVPITTSVPVTTLLPPGGRAGFHVTVDTDLLGLTGFGVYPLSIEATDQLGALARVRTFLPWSERRQGYDPTSLVWAWPLVTAPRRDATGATVGPPLSAELTPTARLGRLVDAAAAAPVTWVVDPDLLAASAAQARLPATATPTTPGAPSPVPPPAPAPTPAGPVTTTPGDPPDTSPAGPSPSGTGPSPARTGPTGPATPPVATGGVPTPDPQVADEWLRVLRRHTLGRPLIRLPYADPDLTALAHAGRMGQVRSALTEGGDVVADVLGRSASGAVAWPADGMLDTATAGALRRAGFTGVILDAATLPDGQERTYTPTGRVDVRTRRGVLHGVVADPTLSGLLAGHDGATGSVLAVQRFLAETAMITAERPNQARTVLVTPPREWAPEGDLAAALLTAVRQAQWVRLTGIGQMLAIPAERTVPATELVYPQRARAAELPGHLLTQLRRTEERAGELASALTRPQHVVDGVRMTAERLTAVHWRQDPGSAVRLAARLADHVATLYAGIRVQASPLVLSGRAGTFPVTVVNDLDQPIRVRVRLTPDSGRIRLRSGNGQVVLVAARRRTQVNVPVEAVANGEVAVTARLATPTGRPLGQPVRVAVRVAQIGPVGLVVTVGAAVVLFVAAGVQLARRVRRR